MHIGELTTVIGEIGTTGTESNEGFVEVIFHLRGTTFGDKIGVVTVRVFFKDPSMTFEQITTEARLVALDHLSQTLKLSGALEIPEGLRQRWR